MGMWTMKMLSDVAERHGQSVPVTGRAAEALLAHERSKGRTEEVYSREQGKRDLDKVLDGGAVKLPDEHSGEYKGVKELRAVVVEHDKLEAAMPKRRPTLLERAKALGGLEEERERE